MKTLAITSGKGGVGKTCMSANLGISLARRGHRTLIFDADLALANLELLLGVKSEFSLQHVVAGEKTLTEIITKGPEGVGLIVGGSAVPALMHAGPKRLAMFFDQVQSLANQTDVLIYDTAAGLENRVMVFLKEADETLLVVTPEPSSVMDAYATAKTLIKMKQDAVIRVVANMVTGESEARGVFAVLQKITNDFLHREIEFAGFVRRDPIVPSCVRQREAFVVRDRGAAAAEDMATLAEAIAGGLTESTRLTA